MSRFIMIAVHKNGKKTAAIRFINYSDVNNNETADIPYANVLATIRNKGNGCIENLEIQSGILKGVNGSIDRYGVIENGIIKSSAVVILDKVVDDNGNTLGYDCCGASGKVWRLRSADVIRLVRKEGIANGKVVNVNGSDIISAIDGNYKEVRLDITTKENKPITKEAAKESINNKEERKEDIKEVEGYKKTDDKAEEKYELIYSDLSSTTVQITGITDRYYDGVVDIPSRHNGKNVVSITSMAFKGTHIVAVRVPSTIVDIGQAAFKDCRLLQEVNLANGRHKFIANNTFEGCVKLSRIEIGNYVERIHEYAFAGTTRLQTIRLPKNLNTIARKAFYCSGIENVEHGSGLKSINDGAFEDCLKLKEFDLEGVITIGARVFCSSGITYAIISKNINKVGRYAFYNCRMSEVNIEEGVEELGEYAFASDEIRQTIDKVYMPKSIKIIGNKSLSNIKVVYVYHGTVAENYCIGHGIEFAYIDEVNETNSTSARQRAAMFNVSIVEMLYSKLSKKIEEEPVIGLNTEKIVHLPLNDDMIDRLKLRTSMALGMNVKPKSQFIEAVNYLTSTHDLYKAPLERLVMRCLDMLYIEGRSLYSDCTNAIVKEKYIKKDNLEEVQFILVIMNDELIFVCEDDNTTEISHLSSLKCDVKVPVEMLHAGDTVGNEGVISGENTRISYKGQFVHVGLELFDAIQKCMVSVRDSAHVKYYLDLRSDKVIRIADQRTYDKDGMIRRGTPDYLNITEVLNKEELYKRMNKARKPLSQNSKILNELMGMTDSEVQLEVNRLGTVFPLSINQLYIIAKAFREKIGNIERKDVDISLMDIKLFREVAGTYWMVEKDITWFNSIGKSSLNVVSRNKIGDRVVEEYKSNQVVKFYNPYMQGGKGAHIFVVKNGTSIEAVYASRMTLKTIAINLFEMTNYDENEANGVEVMSGTASNIDSIKANLFFKFYDILERKNGWGYNANVNDWTCEFAISMFKPTGAMYIVMYGYETVYTSRTEKERRVRTCKPIFMVGDIDRALEVAKTTNTITRAKEIAKEMVTFATYENISYLIDKRASNDVYRNYIKARELSMSGEARVSEYEGLINDRLAMMIGIKSENGPRIYNSAYKGTIVTYDSTDDDIMEDEEEFSAPDVEYSTEDEVVDDEEAIEIPASDIEFKVEDEVNDEDDELADGDYYIDIDGDSEDEEYYEDSDEYADDDNGSMIEMMMNLSEEELKELGMTVEQREDMIRKIKSGELKI